MKDSDTQKFICNMVTFNIITNYEKPTVAADTKYKTNPSRGDLWVVYAALKSHANSVTGITVISRPKLQEISGISTPKKITTCLQILQDLGLIYYLRGGKFNLDDPSKTSAYSNKYIFLREHWREQYPSDPALYDDYILDPHKYISGNKKTSPQTKSESAPDKPKKEKAPALTHIFKINGPKAYNTVSDHEYFKDLISKQTCEQMVMNKAFSPTDWRTIQEILKYWADNPPDYKDRAFICPKYWQLNNDEIEWINQYYLKN